MVDSVQRTFKNPLLSRFDVDPGPWRPMYYTVTIPVGVEANQSEEGSISLQNQPFIMTAISHQIIGNTGDPETSGLYQDGQYSISVKDEQSNYQNQPLPAAAAFGGPSTGYTIELPLPIAYPGSKTLTFRIVNHYTRILTPEPSEPIFNVKLVVCGMADWGKLM